MCGVAIEYKVIAQRSPQFLHHVNGKFCTVFPASTIGIRSMVCRGTEKLQHEINRDHGCIELESLIDLDPADNHIDIFVDLIL